VPDPTFQIPKDVIEPIIQMHISAAVATALGDKSEILNAVISQVLNQKVDEQGKPCNYAHHNVTYIQWLMQTAIRDAVKQAIVEEVVKHKESLRAALAKELGTPGKSRLAKALLDGMIAGFVHQETLRYRVEVSVK